MEDRYLFRGKRIDNREWAIGNSIYDGVTGQVFIHTVGNSVNESDKVGEEGCLQFVAFEVDPSTVCQCTGRNDKNGKLIYENDIMVAYYDEENPVMVVWRECGLVAVENNSDELCPLDYFTQKHFYVVGNIFDNPELLEVRL